MNLTNKSFVKSNLFRRLSPLSAPAIRCGWILVLLALPATNAPGQNRIQTATKEISSDEKSIASASEVIERLSRKNYAGRQANTIEMWLDESMDLEILRSALDNVDPEVAHRVQWIMDRRRLGITADMPGDIAAVLAKQRGKEKIVTNLLHYGRFDIAFRELQSRQDDPDFHLEKVRASAYIRQFFPSYALVAYRDDRVEDLLNVVDMVATSAQMCLCRIELMKWLGIDVTSANHLPSSASKWDEARRRRLEAVMLLMRGQREAAIALADRSNDWGESFDWAASNVLSIVERFEDPSSQKSGENDSSALMAAYWRCIEVGDKVDELAVAQETFDSFRGNLIERLDGQIDAILADDEFELRSEKPEVRSVVGSIRNRCFALLRTGNADLALSKLAKIDSLTAAELAMDCGRYRDAEQYLWQETSELELPREHQSGLWQTYVVGAMQGSSQTKRNARGRLGSDEVLDPDVRRLMIRFTSLWMAGQQDHAATIAKELWAHLTWLESLPNENLLAATVASEFAKHLSGRNHQSLIFELIDQYPGPLTELLVSVVVESTSDIDEAGFAMVRESLREMYPDRSPAEHLAMTVDVVGGDRVMDVGTPVDFKSMVENWSSMRLTQQEAGQVMDEDSSIQNETWSKLTDMLYRNGEIKLGDRLFDIFALDASPDAMLAIATRRLDENNVAEAATIYQRLIDRELESFGVVKRGENLVLIDGGSASTEQLIDAAVGLMKCRQSLGMDDSRLGPVLECLLCCPSNSILDTIVQKADTVPPETMLELSKRSLMMACISSDTTDAYQPAISYQRLVERMAVRNDIEPLQSPAYWYSVATLNFEPYTQWWIQIAHRVSSLRLDQAIHHRDLTRAEAAIDAILDTTPLDITLAESTVKQMREIGWDELAEKTLQRIVTVGEQHMNDYPTDFATANNLAWIAAVGNRHLDKALNWSRQAVAAYPESVIYRDTLAEVLFVMGREKEAAQIERACLLDDDGDWHVHKQIDRFSQSNGR